jgi:hypothetical protein
LPIDSEFQPLRYNLPGLHRDTRWYEPIFSPHACHTKQWHLKPEEEQNHAVCMPLPLFCVAALINAEEDGCKMFMLESLVSFKSHVLHQ